LAFEPYWTKKQVAKAHIVRNKITFFGQFIDQCPLHPVNPDTSASEIPREQGVNLTQIPVEAHPMVRMVAGMADLL
jgi:hypothetical protein